MFGGGGDRASAGGDRAGDGGKTPAGVSHVAILSPAETCARCVCVGCLARTPTSRFKTRARHKTERTAPFCARAYAQRGRETRAENGSSARGTLNAPRLALLVPQPEDRRQAPPPRCGCQRRQIARRTWGPRSTARRYIDGGAWSRAGASPSTERRERPRDAGSCADTPTGGSLSCRGSNVSTVTNLGESCSLYAGARASSMRV